MTVSKCLQKAWACLLAGDTEGRDEWCVKAEHIQSQIDRVRAGRPLMPGKPIQLVMDEDGILTSKVHKNAS